MPLFMTIVALVLLACGIFSLNLVLVLVSFLFFFLGWVADRLSGNPTTLTGKEFRAGCATGIVRGLILLAVLSLIVLAIIAFT